MLEDQIEAEVDHGCGDEQWDDGQQCTDQLGGERDHHRKECRELDGSAGGDSGGRHGGGLLAARKVKGEAEGGGRVPRCDTAGAAKRDRWTPDRMTLLALVTICCGSHHRESGPIERNRLASASVLRKTAEVRKSQELRPLFCALFRAPDHGGPGPLQVLAGRPPGDIAKRPRAALP
ncbi:hypothetical protein Scani_61590 [Streptomyces caniferus]|uniref:Uncharacterized protein n=1 Tax=Streptomyces caniferus TaxID=285557 RepID=A0A640SHQ4_9ACTN|nr:hypothetical protein Scani_61590 [Streptomyces caniferus]